MGLLTAMICRPMGFVILVSDSILSALLSSPPSDDISVTESLTFYCKPELV